MYRKENFKTISKETKPDIKIVSKYYFLTKSLAKKFYLGLEEAVSRIKIRNITSLLINSFTTRILYSILSRILGIIKKINLARVHDNFFIIALPIPRNPYFWRNYSKI